MNDPISVCEARMMLDQAHRILIRMIMDISDGQDPSQEDIQTLHKIIERVNISKWTTNYY